MEPKFFHINTFPMRIYYQKLLVKGSSISK